jgi:hypothetical protein
MSVAPEAVTSLPIRFSTRIWVLGSKAIRDADPGPEGLYSQLAWNPLVHVATELRGVAAAPRGARPALFALEMTLEQSCVRRRRRACLTLSGVG